ncbi:hypothetical protein PCC9214_05545 [Planktothrix tepida]|uniref:hypothetical protein n=1 Tax=Planktothrix tepida TaxID=1678309 RepID=UPI00093521B1|nr:hypothetical protein [Planktothrix tepida]CAD5989343.1 hypothetical protein PCC9214_05545 [Planktothrix tepida]
MKTALTLFVAALLFNPIFAQLESSPKSSEITSKKCTTKLIESDPEPTRSEPIFNVLSGENDDDCDTVPTP